MLSKMGLAKSVVLAPLTIRGRKLGFCGGQAREEEES
jgi:hypothetical protein